MNAEILVKDDIEIGKRVEVIALCSEVEVHQNLSTTGSFREIYKLHGLEGAFVSGILFKNFGINQVNQEAYADVPVLVSGTVGEYRGVKQIHIEKIMVLDMLDKEELLAAMVDTKILDLANDILFEHESLFTLTFEHLKPASGLEESTAGTFVIRLLRFLQIVSYHYPELTREYIKVLSLLTTHYLKSASTLNERLDLLRVKDTELLRAILFNSRDYPDYEDFVKLHHLIMKPRGCTIEILDSSLDYNSVSSRNIREQ